MAFRINAELTNSQSQEKQLVMLKTFSMYDKQNVVLLVSTNCHGEQLSHLLTTLHCDPLTEFSPNRQNVMGKDNYTFFHVQFIR